MKIFHRFFQGPPYLRLFQAVEFSSQKAQINKIGPTQYFYLKIF